MKKRLEGRVVLVTGAARGIGAAAARRMAEEGAEVLVTDVLDDEGLAVTEEIRRSGGRAEYVHLDVRSEQEWQSAVEAAVRTFGSLNVLVNNAAVANFNNLETETLEGFNNILSVNVVGSWLGMKTAVPEIRKAGGGSIIILSSIYGAVGGSGVVAAYHATKGALRIMTKNAANRYAKENIRVNSVHPGIIDTPMIRTFLENKEYGERVRQYALSMTPMGRMGRPEEIAGAIVFLASDDASYMTGSEMYIDGGWTAS